MENVEVPLVYAGISRADRHIRAREVLEQVGLGEDVYKRQAFTIPGSVAEQRQVGLGHGNLGARLLSEDTTCLSLIHISNGHTIANCTNL